MCRTMLCRQLNTGLILIIYIHEPQLRKIVARRIVFCAIVTSQLCIALMTQTDKQTVRLL